MMREDRRLRLAEASIVVGTVLGFTLSYSALRRLAEHHGYDAWEAALWPLAVDFVAVACTALAMALARRHGGPTGETWVVAGAAALVSLAGNVASAWGDAIAMAMHAWAAAVYIALWHAFFRAVQAGPPGDDEERVAAAPAAAGPPIPDTPTVIVRPSADSSDGRDGDRRVAWSWPLSDLAGGREDGAAVDTAATMATAIPGRAVAHDQPPDMATRMTAEDARATVARLVRRARASGREVTAGDVRRATGSSERQARRLLAAAVGSDRSVRPPSPAGRAATSAVRRGLRPLDPQPPPRVQLSRGRVGGRLVDKGRSPRSLGAERAQEPFTDAAPKLGTPGRTPASLA
jgi:hypothetical protein